MLNGKELNFSQYIFMNIYTISYHFYLPKIQIMKKIIEKSIVQSQVVQCFMSRTAWHERLLLALVLWIRQCLVNTPGLLPRMDGCQPLMRVVDLVHDATPFALGGRHYERNHFESLVDSRYEYTNNNTVIFLSEINTLTINSLFVSASLQHHQKCRTIDLIQGFSGDVALLAHACNKCYRCLSQNYLHTRYLVL